MSRNKRKNQRIDHQLHMRLTKQHFIARAKQRTGILLGDYLFNLLADNLNGNRSNNKDFKILNKYCASKPGIRQQWILCDTALIGMGTIWILYNRDMCLPVTCLSVGETPSIVIDNDDLRYDHEGYLNVNF